MSKEDKLRLLKINIGLRLNNLGMVVPEEHEPLLTELEIFLLELFKLVESEGNE